MSKNQHIKNYLEYYVTKFKGSPEYAVLLRGKWGVGKTFFIKQFIKDKKLEKKHLYVSLYGITSFPEIQFKLFEQLYPRLASKKSKFLGLIFKALLKASTKIDLNSIILSEYLSKGDNKLLIFDDLERCGIEIHNILGYINQYIENQGIKKGTKVIIIADETKILFTPPDNTQDLETYEQGIIKEKVSKSQKYQSIKEKVIGKSFDIEDDFDGAFEFFINNLQTDKEDTKKLFEENKGVIENIYLQADYKNLRHLRQTILDFERFSSFIFSVIKDKKDLIEHIIQVFFSISFELKKGKITEDDIKEYYISSRDLKVGDTMEKYSVFNLKEIPIDKESLISFFKSGKVDEAELHKGIKNSFYFENEKTPTHKKLQWYWKLSDEELNLYYTEVKDKFENGKYTDVYDLISVTEIFLFFHQEGFRKVNEQDDIIEKATENLKYVEIDEDQAKRYLRLESDLSPYYRELQRDEYDIFLKKIKEHMQQIIGDNLPEKAKTLLLAMNDESFETFKKYLSSKNNDSSLDERYDYYAIPIFNHIEVSDFVNAYMNLHNKYKYELPNIIYSRYQYASSLSVNLRGEERWLKGLKIELKKQKVSKLTAVHINSIVTQIDISIHILNNGVV